MLTQAPLPDWLNICRALFPRTSVDEDLAVCWRREGEVTGWLSRSAWSFALIALWRKCLAPSLPVTVWLPDFFCNSSLTALRKAGVRLVFYPLTDKMTPDISACRSLVDSNPPDLFVLVHYFGQPAPAAATRDFCSHHGAWLIEDATHVLRPVEGVGTCGDFVLYSPHKHLAIPDGAVLVARPNGPAKLGLDRLVSFGLPSSWPSQLKDLQQHMGIAHSRGRTRALVWLAKRLLQKLGVRTWHQLKPPFLEPCANHTVSLQLTSPCMSEFAKRLLVGCLPVIGSVARQRQRHQLLWDALLLNDEDSRSNIVLAAGRPVKREWTPYLAAYQVNLAVAGKVYDDWQQQDLPVTTWPDLPPEVIMNRAHHVNAWNLRHAHLYLPLHQSMCAAEIIARCPTSKTIQKCEPLISLDWDAATEAQWQQWMVQAGCSNLLQSWSYGKSKSDCSSWRVKRGIFYFNGEPIAIVQVLQKSLAGMLTVSRINRGPLFLRPLPLKDQRAIWKKLAQLGCIWRGKVLSAAPELALSGGALSLMTTMGFKQFSINAWESIWLDLELELDVLRKRLDGKWRNMLTFSEKAGLKLEIGSDDELFDWMVAQYQELMKDKNFSGPPIELLLNLRKQLGDESQLVVLRAMHEEEPVAGICLARHGVAATYLLGWNGHIGRNLKANQYLLWQAIVYLKQSGYSWFDLGGISEEHTPGITAFKSGLNGDPYELVGEYWKW